MRTKNQGKNNAQDQAQDQTQDQAQDQAQDQTQDKAQDQAEEGQGYAANSVVRAECITRQTAVWSWDVDMELSRVE